MGERSTEADLVARALAASGLGAWSASDGALTLCPRARALLGFDEAATATADGVAERLAAGDARRLRAFLDEAARGAAGEVELLTASRPPRALRLRGGPAPGAAGAHGIVEDVTPARARAQAALGRAQRLGALGQLTAGVAHDLRNALHPVVLGYELLDQLVAEPRARPAIERGRKAARRATLLVDEVTAFGRRAEAPAAPLDPAALLGELEPLLRNAAGVRVRCTVDVDPGAWTVVAEAHRLEVALVSLVVNAREALPEGGAVDVSVRNHAVPPWPGLPPGAWVVFAVQDFGAGMAPEVLARAGEPFFTTRPRGAGLGLATARAFAVESGGALRIESAEGQGTRVALALPRG